MDDKNSHKGLFPSAQNYPAFFNNNLVEDSRVIKVLEGPLAIFRAFYYQLLKLAFELQLQVELQDAQRNVKSMDYSDALLVIIQQSTGNYPHYHHIKTIQAFIKAMQAQPGCNFQYEINNRLEIDEAFTGVLKHIYEGKRIQKPDMENIFSKIQKLSEVFQIHAETYDQCIKFEQSDVFLYVEAEEELYVAYLDLEEDEDLEEEEEETKIKTEIKPQFQIDSDPRIARNSYQEDANQGITDHYTSQQNFETEQNRIMEEERKKEKRQEKSKPTNNDTIINIMGDMLTSSKGGDSKISNSFMTNNPNNSINAQLQPTPTRKMTKNRNSPDNNTKTEELIQQKDVFHQQKNSLFKRESINTNKQSVSVGDESQVQPFKYSKSGGFNSKSEKNEHTEEQFFYNPKAKQNIYTTNLQTISEVTASKESLLQSRPRRKDPLDYENEEEKGTFYRQFTNTRILNILPEPHRTKVKMLKNRFIGVHGVRRSNIRQN